MTPSTPSAAPTANQEPEQAVTATITVPNSVSMVSLLGVEDALLRVIEAAFPEVDVLARGNEITLTGDSDDLTLIDLLLHEMFAVLRTGQALSPDAVERSIAMLRAQAGAPSEVLTENILSNRGKTIRPKSLNQKRYVDAIDKHTIVFGIGPAGTGKTYLAVAKAVQALQSKTGQPDHPDPTRGRGRRVAGLPAGHPQREDRPIPATAVRRAARHDRPRLDSAPDGQRHYRGCPVGIHAWPHAERRFCHSG